MTSRSVSQASFVTWSFTLIIYMHHSCQSSNETSRIRSIRQGMVVWLWRNTAPVGVNTMSTFQQYQAASKLVDQLSTQHQTDGTHPVGQPLCKACMDAIKSASHLLVQLWAEQSTYLAGFPPVPQGYYIGSCHGPEGDCVGWHCYRATDGSVSEVYPIDGYFAPTAGGYCDGGSPLTQAWLQGELTDVDDYPSGLTAIDPK